jgi:hypothetical protein
MLIASLIIIFHIQDVLETVEDVEVHIGAAALKNICFESVEDSWMRCV